MYFDTFVVGPQTKSCLDAHSRGPGHAPTMAPEASLPCVSLLPSVPLGSDEKQDLGPLFLFPHTGSLVWFLTPQQADTYQYKVGKMIREEGPA